MVNLLFGLQLVSVSDIHFFTFYSMSILHLNMMSF